MKMPFPLNTRQINGLRQQKKKWMNWLGQNLENKQVQAGTRACWDKGDDFIQMHEENFNNSEYYVYLGASISTLIFLVHTTTTEENPLGDT